MGPAQMPEVLKKKHPGKYSLPSESEICTEISVPFNKQKNNLDNNGASCKRGHQSKVPKNVD